MKYWEEFSDKGGFSDGAAIPADAWLQRQVAVETINQLAAQRGSAVRYAAYDRPGPHNGCMVALVSVATAEFLGAEIGTLGLQSPQTVFVAEDAAMSDAVAYAQDMADEIAEQVVVEVHIADTFPTFLARLAKG